MADCSILVALRPINFQGKNILGSRWHVFTNTLRTHLRQDGFEAPISSEELLLFRYNCLESALTSIFENLETVKQEFNWPTPSANLPIQLVLHLTEDDSIECPIIEASADFWNILESESIYITPSLQEHLRQYFKEKKIPCSFINLQNKLYKIALAEKSNITTARLFPHRHLPLQGDYRECFYCGMKSHRPAACPSKFLSMGNRAINEAAYLPLHQLGEYYKEVMASPQNTIRKLEAGIKDQELRKDGLLTAFISYFDIFTTFQLRFLWRAAFTKQWDCPDPEAKYCFDDHNVYLGLDCLRVGNYDKAEKLLTEATGPKTEKQFYALIGLAFIALEKGRPHEMGHMLDSAYSFAQFTKEKIYCNLLLARHYELMHDYWKAQHTLDKVIQLDHSSFEARYRCLLIDIKSGFSENALGHIKSLLADRKDFFMILVMDPQLINIDGFVDKILTDELRNKERIALNCFSIAKQECRDLKKWYGETNDELQHNDNALEILSNKLRQKTYFDFLDVIYSANGLSQSCKEFKQAELDRLAALYTGSKRHVKAYQFYWKTFRYKNFFYSFGYTLKKLEKDLDEMNSWLDKSDTETYQTGKILVEKIKGNLQILKHSYFRLHLTTDIMDKVLIFFKKLIISELSFATLIHFLLPLLLILFSDSLSSGLAKTLQDPDVQKQLKLFTMAAISPLLAFSLTLWEIKNNSANAFKRKNTFL